MAERAIYSRDGRTDLRRCGCLHCWCWPCRSLRWYMPQASARQEKGKEFWVIILKKGSEVGAFWGSRRILCSQQITSRLVPRDDHLLGQPAMSAMRFFTKSYSFPILCAWQMSNQGDYVTSLSVYGLAQRQGLSQIHWRRHCIRQGRQQHRCRMHPLFFSLRGQMPWMSPNNSWSSDAKQILTAYHFKPIEYVPFKLLLSTNLMTSRHKSH